ARHHRHGPEPRPRAREPVEPGHPRARDRARLHRHALRRRLREPRLPAGLEEARAARRRGARPPRAAARDLPRAERPRRRRGARRAGAGGRRDEGGRVRAASRRRRGADAGHGDNERWLLTYSDMITLLMALFIVMWAISSVNVSKFDQLKASLRSAFSGRVVPADVSVLTGQ